ncbi:hypothetical protein HPG69_000623 [Diceros bicornis minor]|uniref:Uncharacterized protein n=1 Tax=Diceros bicornis minor TaxID=77932 RepID=A0A7J7FIC4_DICBM|nr:hypothetical protein HPG69_000623 [Diceros bicornis minor]
MGSTASLDQFHNDEENYTVFVDVNHLDIQGSKAQSNRKLTPSTFLYNIDRAAQRIHTMGQLKLGPTSYYRIHKNISSNYASRLRKLDKLKPPFLNGSP